MTVSLPASEVDGGILDEGTGATTAFRPISITDRILSIIAAFEQSVFGPWMDVVSFDIRLPNDAQRLRWTFPEEEVDESTPGFLWTNGVDLDW